MHQIQQNLQYNRNVPEEYLCPITRQLMKFPHSLSCGHTFEKDALDQWMIFQSFCPCRTPTEGLTVVNWALKSLIERFNSAISQSVNSNAVILNNTNIQEPDLKALHHKLI